MITAERQHGGGGATTETAATTATAARPQQSRSGHDGSGSVTPLSAASSSSSSALLHPLPAAPARGQTRALPQAPSPMRHAPKPGVRRKQGRRGRGGLWREPMTAAVLVGTVLVSLLCVYVYAYARVTVAGYEAARLRRTLVKAQQEEQDLRARISDLSLPSTVARRAKKLGMEMAPPEAMQMISTSEAAAPERGGGDQAGAEADANAARRQR